MPPPTPDTSRAECSTCQLAPTCILLPPDASSSQKCQAWLSEHFLHCSVPRHGEAPHISAEPSTSCPWPNSPFTLFLPFWGKPPSSRKPSWVCRRGILPAVCTAPWRPPKPPGSLGSPPLAGPLGSAGSTAAGPPHLPMGQGERV